MKAWSISTTIRNPERIPSFLEVVEKIEGSKWDTKSQEDFYVWAIALRVVNPTNLNLSTKNIKLLETSDDAISYDKARNIFDEKQYQDPPLRGRVQMSPLVDFGVVSTENNIVKITKLGILVKQNKVTFSELMLNFSLKFQVPQPGHAKYKSENGYSIKPLAGSLALISSVNNKLIAKGEKPVGLSWNEFCIFVPTLIDSNKIDECADLILSIRDEQAKLNEKDRKEANWKENVLKYLSDRLDSNETLDYEKLTNTLRDYGDNIYRYFNQSQFFRLRGGGYYVDISEVSYPQVQLLIDTKQYEPLYMATKHDYEEYLSDLNSYTPPWALPEFSKVVIEKLEELLVNKGIHAGDILKQKTKYTVQSVLKEDEKIVNLRNMLKNVNTSDLLSQSTSSDFLLKCADGFEKLSNKKDVEGALERRLSKPVQLEWITYKSLLAINDLKSIKPNYPTDDEGNPTFTAGSGVADLEVFYEGFNVVCEVTMLNNRDQWVAEGQPVQRHLYEFSKKYSSKDAIGIFIAPILHRDTRNTFKQAFHGGYDSAPSLKIIPFDFKNWGSVVKNLAEAKSNGKSITQLGFQKFLESMLPLQDKIETTDEWWNRIAEKDDILEYV